MSKRTRDGNLVQPDTDTNTETNTETHAKHSCNWWYQKMKRDIEERRLGHVTANLRFTNGVVKLNLNVYTQADLPLLHPCLRDEP